jgi:hypothetical protein
MRGFRRWPGAWHADAGTGRIYGAGRGRQGALKALLPANSMALPGVSLVVRRSALNP